MKFAQEFPEEKRRMAWKTAIIAGFLLILAASCGRPVTEPTVEQGALFRAEDVLAAGCHKAVRTHGLVTNAMMMANQVLQHAPPVTEGGRSVTYRLVDGWKPLDPPGDGAVSIPVFLIHAPGGATNSSAWIRVPEGRIGILIEEIPMDAVLNGTESQGTGTAMGFNPQERLALMLLHEVGHVANGDYGAFSEAVARDLSSLNIHENIDKSREFQADAFAAGAIRYVSVNTNIDLLPRLTAMNLGTSLTMWSFDLSTKRMLDHFGAAVLNSPEAFWDRGNSHPNLQLRVLTMQHLLHGSTVSSNLLNDFLAHRRAGTRGPVIMWQAP